MVLNSSRLIPGCRSLYCGMVLYLSNSACQARASSGGTTPVTGFHSTIDRPDSVSRVAPPTITIANTSAAIASSHSRIARCRNSAEVGGGGMRGNGFCFTVRDHIQHDLEKHAPDVIRAGSRFSDKIMLRQGLAPSGRQQNAR